MPDPSGTKGPAAPDAEQPVRVPSRRSAESPNGRTNERGYSAESSTTTRRLLPFPSARGRLPGLHIAAQLMTALLILSHV